MTQEQVAAAYAALCQGTCILQFLADNPDIDANPRQVRGALMSEYTAEVIQPKLQATALATRMFRLKQSFVSMLQNVPNINKNVLKAEVQKVLDSL